MRVNAGCLLNFCEMMITFVHMDFHSCSFRSLTHIILIYGKNVCVYPASKFSAKYMYCDGPPTTKKFDSGAKAEEIWGKRFRKTRIKRVGHCFEVLGGWGQDFIRLEFGGGFILPPPSYPTPDFEK